MATNKRSPEDFRAELEAKNRAKGATLVALNELRVEQDERQEQSDLGDDCLEAIAKKIESTKAAALMQIAALLVEAREIFRYRREEGGFGGWVERRLHFSRDKAYDLLNVHEQFGGESVELFDTLAPTILYELAKPSTPDSARDEILQRAEAGEQLSVAQVKEIVREHKSPPTEELPAGDDAHDGDHHDDDEGNQDIDADDGKDDHSNGENPDPVDDGDCRDDDGDDGDANAADKSARGTTDKLGKRGNKKPTSKSCDSTGTNQQQLRVALEKAATQLAYVAAQGEPADIAAIVAADSNLRAAFAKIAPGWLAEFARVLDAAPPPRKRKVKQQEMSVARAVTGAYSELVELGQECREVVDNAPEGLSESPRIQTLDQTAGELENLLAPDVPDAIGAIVLQIPIGGRVRSRADRAAVACEELQAVVKALEAIPEGDDRYQNARELLQEVQGVVDAVDGGDIQFPGMFQ